MFEGRASLRAVERGQVCAYPLGTRLPYVQPGADRAHRRHATGRKLDCERLGRSTERAPAQPLQQPAPRQFKTA
jgi:hypothetical protein